MVEGVQKVRPGMKVDARELATIEEGRPSAPRGRAADGGRGRS